MESSSDIAPENETLPKCLLFTIGMGGGACKDLQMVLRSAVSICLCLLTIGVHAEDLGTIGPTYEIAERDLIEVIKDKYRDKDQVAKLHEDYKKKVIEGIENPRPVPGVRPTEVARTYYIDPTYILERNIVDEHGRILFPAGTKVNPFDYDSMSKILLFFDARDKKQVEYALRLIKSGQQVKPILIAGKPLDLMRKWKRPVYYDQGGALTRRFAIQQSPAIVRQEGKRLRVDEIRL